MIFEEGELRFDFAGCVRAEKLDAPERTRPEGMSLVDFVVEEEGQTLLIEVKDPSDSRAPEAEREAFVRRLEGNTLIAANLVPKCRDSYTWLHLMRRDGQPMVYVVLLGVDDPALLLGFKDRLLARLRQEAEEAWKRLYVRDCAVGTPEAWREIVKRYRVERVG